jgi:hypothetical protein
MSGGSHPEIGPPTAEAELPIEFNRRVLCCTRKGRFVGKENDLSDRKSPLATVSPRKAPECAPGFFDLEFFQNFSERSAKTDNDVGGMESPSKNVVKEQEKKTLPRD